MKNKLYEATYYKTKLGNRKKSYWRNKHKQLIKARDKILNLQCMSVYSLMDILYGTDEQKYTQSNYVINQYST